MQDKTCVREWVNVCVIIEKLLEMRLLLLTFVRRFRLI